MEEIKTLYKFRPDEIFRRITVTSLATLMIECSKLEYQQEDSARLTRFVTEIESDQIWFLPKASAETKGIGIVAEIFFPKPKLFF